MPDPDAFSPDDPMTADGGDPGPPDSFANAHPLFVNGVADVDTPDPGVLAGFGGMPPNLGRKLGHALYASAMGLGPDDVHPDVRPYMRTAALFMRPSGPGRPGSSPGDGSGTTAGYADDDAGQLSAPTGDAGADPAEDDREEDGDDDQDAVDSSADGQDRSFPPQAGPQSHNPGGADVTEAAADPVARTPANQADAQPGAPTPASPPDSLATVQARTQRLKIAQEAAFKNPAFQPKHGLTHCSEATFDIAKRVGIDSSPFGDEKFFNANTQTRNLEKASQTPGSGWRKVKRTEAQAYANQGKFVVLGWVNPRGPGHTATVFADSANKSLDNPTLAQVGGEVGRRTFRRSFGPDKWPNTGTYVYVGP